MKRVNLLASGIFLLGQALSVAAIAAPVTLAGSTVDFSFDDSLLGLFGPASVAGDTLYFTPRAFDVQSLNGSGFALSNETINLRISARSGYEFNSLNLTERGDYLLLGSGGMVDVGGQLRVFDATNPISDITSSIAASGAMTMIGLPTHNWQATAAANLTTLDAREINVTVQNLLLASTTSSGSLAFIEKKFAGLTVDTVAVTPVPEAETWAMMLAGLGLLGLVAGRRRQMT
jgi:MYXO-CTERM domain-containing protein